MLDFSGIRFGDKYDRKWLAKNWRFTSFHPLAKGVFCPRGGGQIILFVTRDKQKSQEQYNDRINGDRLYWEGEIKHGHDERIERAKSNGEKIHLFYRDEHQDEFEYKGLIELLSAKRLTNKPSEFVFRLLNDITR
jgi:putative restriction endonuclease